MKDKTKIQTKNADFFNQKSWKIFLSYYKPHWKIFALDILCAVLIALIDIIFPMVSKYTIDSIIPNKNLKLFLVLIIVWLLFTLCAVFLTGLLHIGATILEL